MIEIGSSQAGSLARYENTIADTHQPAIRNTPSPTLILPIRVHQTPSPQAATDRITIKKLHTDTTRLNMELPHLPVSSLGRPVVDRP